MVHITTVFQPKLSISFAQSFISILMLIFTLISMMSIRTITASSPSSVCLARNNQFVCARKYSGGFDGGWVELIYIWSV